MDEETPYGHTWREISNELGRRTFECACGKRFRQAESLSKSILGITPLELVGEDGHGVPFVKLGKCRRSGESAG